MYVYGVVPPPTVRVTVPLVPPLQFTLVPAALAVRVAGCVIVLLVVAVQPLASVTVTEYVPALRVVRSCVVAPLLHK